MIVLLTDFEASEYVGVMKGVIYSIAPQVKVVDLCHSICHQNVIEASWVLKNNYKYFPAGAIFCCVVDPTVGTERKAIAIKTEKYYFVGPDNGLFWEALGQQRVVEIRQIAVTAGTSRTFHGRDVFAKAAAGIELGGFEKSGKTIKKIEKLQLYQKDREGIVVRIDRFGNIVTNIPSEGKDSYSVVIGQKEYAMRFRLNYSVARQGQLFFIEGSNNTLEISLKNASANDRLHLRPGAKIKIS